MLKIYKITNEFFDSIDRLNDLEGEVPAEILQETFGALSEEIAINVAATVKNLELEVEAMKVYEADMRTKRKCLEAKIDSFKNYMLDNMIKNEMTKISCAEFSISVRNNPDSVRLLIDPRKIPMEYQRLKIEADLSAIKEDLKLQKELDFAVLEKKKRLHIETTRTDLSVLREKSHE